MQSELLPQGLCTCPCPPLERSLLKTHSLLLLTSQFCHPREIFPDLCLRHHPSLHSIPWPWFSLYLRAHHSNIILCIWLRPISSFRIQVLNNQRLLFLVSGTSSMSERDSVKTSEINNEWNETFWMQQCVSHTLPGQRLCLLLLVCICNSSSQPWV